MVEEMTRQDRSQETEQAREFARKPACSVNKLCFSLNEKHFLGPVVDQTAPVSATEWAS
jgi:hypothetical protein